MAFLDNAKQVVSYAGLSPKRVQSGTSINQSSLSKARHKKLRKSLYMPALVAIKHNPLMRAFYRGLMDSGKPKKVAIIAVMQKLSACCEAPVLIEGETGSGKEMAARAIHYLSSRSDYPFIPVNCGAIPDHLVENELFGHEKGAYTDAKQSQSGVISQADGGTLFLDEIEVLSEKGQVVLLRFIEDQNIKPLGSKQCKKVNVRIVAATNVSLSVLVSQRRFRQDLLFRLNLLSIRLPPLRERMPDIECLIGYFMEKFRKQYQQPDNGISPELIEWMKQYDWPGNVRELENYIHRQFLLTENSIIPYANPNKEGTLLKSRRTLFDRRQDFQVDSTFQDAKKSVINQFEKRYLSWLMAQTHDNVSKAAGISGKERRALGKLLTKHDINPNQYRNCALISNE